MPSCHIAEGQDPGAEGRRERTDRAQMHILNCDTDREEYNDQNLANLLTGVIFDDPSLEQRVVISISNVHQGRLPNPNEHYDGVLITGSGTNIITGTPDSAPWVPLLLRYLQSSQAPTLGICFGHQAITAARGGQVAPIGLEQDGSSMYEMGYLEITLNFAGQQSPLFRGFPNPFRANQSHRNRVVQLPGGAIELARNAMGIQAAQYDNHTFGIQFHPEIYPRSAQITMERRQGSRGILGENIRAYLGGKLRCEYEQIVGYRPTSVIRNFIQAHVLQSKE